MKIENVEVFGLDRVFKTAKYPKAVDTAKAILPTSMVALAESWWNDERNNEL